MTIPAKSFSEIWGSTPEDTLDGAVRPDAVIADRYRLEVEIGAGGMARVWRAHDLRLDRPVAVKFLFLREGRDQKTMIDRFLREARIAASVRHPNVVDVLDFGTIPGDGRPFMVMELLEGQSLDDRLGEEPASSVQDHLQGVLTRLPSRRLGELPLSPGPSSLDSEFAWGAGAVPSFGAPAETVAETPCFEAPRAKAEPWTVDTQLTVGVKSAGARPRSKARYWIAAGLIAPVVGVALSLLLWEPSEEVPVAPPIEAALPTSEIPEATPPPAPPAARVTVTLGDLPTSARVLIDGEPVEVDEGAFELPRDGAEHTIRVEARSWRPWTTVHRADGDGTYRVRLRRTSTVFRDLDH